LHATERRLPGDDRGPRHGTARHGTARHGTASRLERLVRNYRKVKRSDALERIVDGYLCGGPTGELTAELFTEPGGDRVTVKGGDRCTLHVHTDMNTLQEDGDGAESERASGGYVSAETYLR